MLGGLKIEKSPKINLAHTVKMFDSLYNTLMSIFLQLFFVLPFGLQYMYECTGTAAVDSSTVKIV
jgi:hypothetical protein